MWKQIKNYPRYEINELGDVRIIETKYVLTKYKNSSGYYRVMLLSPLKVKHNEFIHRLVAETFIPNPNNYKYVNHKDENKNNNAVQNLEWCTSSYNRRYGTISKKLSSIFSVPIVSEDQDEIIIYDSFKNAAIFNNVTPGNISRIFRKSNRNGLKKHWRYATPKEIELLHSNNSIILKLANN